MAAADKEKIAIINSLRAITQTLINAQATAAKVLAQNNAQAVVWNDETPGTISEEFDFMEGTEVSNVIGSLDNFANTYWTTHGGNYQKIVSDRPISK